MPNYTIMIQADGGFTVPDEMLTALCLIVGDEVELEIKDAKLIVTKAEIQSHQ